MDSYTVLVTAIGSFSARAVIAALQKDGARVVGCDIYPAKWVAASGLADVFYQAPLACEQEKYLAFIKETVEKEAVDLVIPLTDAEVDVFAQTGEDLDGKLALSPLPVLSLCRDKRAMAGLAESICPDMYIPYTEAEGKKPLSYPAILKPAGGRSSQGLYRLQDEADFADAKRRILREGTGELSEYILQPCVRGHVVTVDMVVFSDAFMALPREELLRTANGAGLSVRVFRDERLERACELLARAAGVRGCVNFEFIKEDDTGKYKFLECNPRFSGGVGFSQLAGCDMVTNHIRAFNGGSMRQCVSPQTGYMVKSYSEYFLG